MTLEWPQKSDIYVIKVEYVLIATLIDISFVLIVSVYKGSKHFLQWYSFSDRRYPLVVAEVFIWKNLIEASLGLQKNRFKFILS